LALISTLTFWSAAASAEMSFIHPGALDTRASLDFVRNRIAAGDQPWKKELNEIRNSNAASRGPSKIAHISSHQDAGIARDDALAAYTQALLWQFTGDRIYAERSIAILNTWSNFQGFTLGTDQDKLHAGWIGAVFAPAAEIMRGYSEWSPAQIAGLQAMFKRAFYPQLEIASSWNGNVDLTQTDALISIAVFNEDEDMFKLALARIDKRNPAYFYLTSDGIWPAAIGGDGGDLQGFWFNPVVWVDGLNQETCRDNGHHSQYALGSALHVAEVAWNQGVDIYTPNQARYTAALELMATQFLTDSFATCINTTPTTNRFNTWEVGYNHYHNRAGIDLPNTERLIMQQIRTDSVRAAWNLVYETLTHAGVSGVTRSE